MDCNKDEAVRAKEIAGRKMETKEFSAAKKFVLKAQQLFSKLDNIPQMLTVCEVQCSAETKVNNELDWYSILQVEQKADDSLIRKQYRKLALILHPDKNKSPGAEAAFKLICQANTVLSDQAKRTAYDMKRKAKFTAVLPCPPKFSSTPNIQFSKVNLQKSADDNTFWTMCPNCAIKYQFYRNIMNKLIQCHNCLTDYTAFQTKQPVPLPLHTNGSLKRKQNAAKTEKISTKDKPAKKKRGKCVALESSSSNTESDSEHIILGDNPYSRKQSISEKFKKDTIKHGQDHEAVEEELDIKSFSLPDSEFYDFEQERHPRKFKADQIWAIYDEANALPRYYCMIQKVVYEPFKLQYTWLEHNPINEFEKTWTHEELPVACGNYTLGELQSCTYIEAFSHLMHFRKGRKKNTFDIYPNRGEIWALITGWDVSSSRKAESHKDYKYKAVEIMSDTSSGTTKFEVMNLTKVEGFLSLFVRCTSSERHLIRGPEVLRFSHRVPAYKMLGSEGVVFFELDSASLPVDFKETFPCIDFDASSINVHKLNYRENIDEGIKTEFHDFDKDRSFDKFEQGQIWAVYSEIDELPKFYVKIRKIEMESNVIHVSWVELYPKGKDERGWLNRKLPAACGTFRVEQETVPSETGTFSHMVHADQVGKIVDLYDIYPRTEEVWAVYKDWSMLWTRLDMARCGYHVVEVLEVTDATVRVALLEKVAMYNFIFRRGGSIMEIALNENLRFSHRIPAFRMTGEVCGALMGYWELDPASLLAAR